MFTPFCRAKILICVFMFLSILSLLPPVSYLNKTPQITGEPNSSFLFCIISNFCLSSIINAITRKSKVDHSSISINFHIMLYIQTDELSYLRRHALIHLPHVVAKHINVLCIMTGNYHSLFLFLQLQKQRSHICNTIFVQTVHWLVQY